MSPPKRLLPLVLASAALSVGVGCEKKTPPSATPPAAAPAPVQTEELLLGLIAPLSGPLASAGTSTRRGIELALREANAAGGVNGRPIRIRVYDDQGKAEESAGAATRLITQDRVRLILGHLTSSSSLAIADKAQAAGVPQITHAATADAVTAKGDYIFRVCFTDPFQGAVMARFVQEKLGIRRVAVFRDSKSAYSIGLSDAFVRRFSELGGEVVASEVFTQGDTDYRAPLVSIRGTRAEAIYLPAYANEAGIVARQARELGMKVLLFGGDGWDSPKLVELGGGAVEGAYFSSHYSADDTSPRSRRFVADFTAAHGEPPDALAALAYDSAMLAVDALRRAKEPGGPALRDALAATREFPGVTGTISFDARRNPVKPAVVLRVTGGRFEYVDSIQP